MEVGNCGTGKIPIKMPQPTPRGKIDGKAIGNNVTGQTNKAVSGISFNKIFSVELEKTSGIKMSAHAERRLIERNVSLNQEDLRKIGDAVQTAASKGARESLVIYGDLALVASVKNRTIITAIQGKDMENHIFTNIDSAVIIS